MLLVLGLNAPAVTGTQLWDLNQCEIIEDEIQSWLDDNVINIMAAVFLSKNLVSIDIV